MITVLWLSDFVDPRIGNSPGSLVLDGLVVRDGNADLGGNSPLGGQIESQGGGAYIKSSIVTIANCIFTNNYAISGGGIYLYGKQLDLLNCVFVTNSAFYHGGGVSTAASDTTVSHCAFASNTAGSTSAALRTSGAAGGAVHHTALTNSVFGGNGGASALNIGTSTELITGNLLQQSIDSAGQNVVSGLPFVSVPDELRLRAGSTGIGGGVIAGIALDLTDMDGDGDTTEPLPLTFDGQARSPVTPDAGPYQFVNLPPTSLAPFHKRV